MCLAYVYSVKNMTLDIIKLNNDSRSGFATQGLQEKASLYNVYR